jgi:hypothetical protein
MPATRRALVERTIERCQHLIPIVPIVPPQVAEIDQTIDKRFGQVEGNSTRSSRRSRDRYMRRPPASTVVDTAARWYRNTAGVQPTLRHAMRLINRGRCRRRGQGAKNLVEVEEHLQRRFSGMSLLLFRLVQRLREFVERFELRIRQTDERRLLVQDLQGVLGIAGDQ